MKVRERPGKDTEQNDQEEKGNRTDVCHEHKERKIFRKDKESYGTNC